MQTMTDLSMLRMEVSELKAIPSATGLIKQIGCATQQAAGFGYQLQIEKWANRFCMAVVTLSALYFTPIIFSIICR